MSKGIHTRESLTVMAVSMRQKLEDFVMDRGVTQQEFCSAVSNACDTIKQVAPDVNNNEAPSVLIGLMRSEEARRRFFDKYDVRSAYDVA